MTQQTRILNRRAWQGVPPWLIAMATRLMVGLAILMYWLVVSRIVAINAALNPPGWWQTLQTNFPLVSVAAPYIYQMIDLFAPRVLIHFLPLLFGVYAGRYITVRVVQMLYDLPDTPTAERLLGRLRGVRPEHPLPLDRVNFARQQTESLLLRVGGPGAVNVSPNDVIVTERNGRYLRFLGPGRQELERFERVRNVLDLRDREQREDGVMLYSREGLPLKTDVQVIFRLRRSLSQPMLATGGNGQAAAGTITDYRLITAVRRAAYAETVGDTGIQRWTDVPLPLAVGELRKLVLQRKLDALLATREDPINTQHDRLQMELETNLRAALDNIGIELISVRFAALQIADELRDVLVDYWKSFGDKASAVPGLHDDRDRGKNAARNRMIDNLAQALADLRARAGGDPLWLRKLLNESKSGGGSGSPPAPPTPTASP